MLDELINLSKQVEGVTIVLKGGYSFELNFNSNPLHADGSIIHADVSGHHVPGGITRGSEVIFDANDILCIQTFEKH